MTTRHADLVIENASVWSDGLESPAEFVAVRDDRFAYVGSFDDALIGTSTKRIDAQGRTVIPGIIDCHVHLLWGGYYLTNEVDLSEAKSLDEFRRTLRDWIDRARDTNTKKLTWIGGGRWNSDVWDPPIGPTRQDIDDITGDIPTLLYRMDGHSALANSTALHLASVTPDTPDPEGGAIDHEPTTGEPTGILRERAIGLVRRLRPEPTLEDKIQACRAASQNAFRHGVTTVGDIVEPENLDAYAWFATRDDEEIDARDMVRSFMYVSDPDWERLIPIVKEFPDRTVSIQVAGLKDFLDGSLGSRTAAMREPYLIPEGEPEPASPCGLFMDGIREGRLARNLETARDHGMQPILHAIGDEANHLLLNALETCYSTHDAIQDARPRAEHAQHLLGSDIARFAKFGLTASMQPYHKATDARIIPGLLGDSRAELAYSWRALAEAGANVAFGSDWPIVTINPFPALAAAAQGRTEEGRLWQTQGNISIDAALRHYTSHAAYAIGAERELGRIAPHYRADCVILDRSPFEAGESGLHSIRPVVTIADGRVAYES